MRDYLVDKVMTYAYKLKIVVIGEKHSEPYSDTAKRVLQTNQRFEAIKTFSAYRFAVWQESLVHSS